MGNNIQLLLYLDTSTHFLWMTFSARLMKRRWTGIESYFPLHRVRKWCFRHLWVQSGIPICLLEIGNGGTARRDVVKVCVLSQRPGGCRVHVCFKRDCGLVTGLDIITVLAMVILWTLHLSGQTNTVAAHRVKPQLTAGSIHTLRDRQIDSQLTHTLSQSN